MTSKDAKVYSKISEHQNPVYVVNAGYEIARKEARPLKGSFSATMLTARQERTTLVALATAAVVMAAMALALVLASPSDGLDVRLATLPDVVAELKAKVGSLEGLWYKVGSLSAEVSGLRGRVESLEAEKGQLKAEVSGLKGRVEILEAEVANLWTNKSRFKTKVEEDKTRFAARLKDYTELDQLTAGIVNVTSSYDGSALEARLANTEAETSRLAAQLANVTSSAAAARVSFMAKGLKNPTPADLETLVFRDVYLNQGGGYNSTTGVFTAPTSGVYSFLAMLQGRGRQAGESTVFVGLYTFLATLQGRGRQVGERTVWVQLLKDGVVLTYVLTKANREDDRDATSLTVILRLSQGQQVWLQAWGDQNRFWNMSYVNTFRACLIYSD